MQLRLSSAGSCLPKVLSHWSDKNFLSLFFAKLILKSDSKYAIRWLYFDWSMPRVLSFISNEIKMLKASLTSMQWTLKKKSLSSMIIHYRQTYPKILVDFDSYVSHCSIEL